MSCTLPATQDAPLHSTSPNETLPIGVAMLPGRQGRGTITSATRGLLRIEFCEHAGEAVAMVAERQAVALFTRHLDANGVPAHGLIGHLRWQRPTLPIVVVQTLPEPPFDASGAGASAVIRMRARHFRQRVWELVRPESHTARRVAMAAGLASLVDENVRHAVRCAIEHGDRPLSAEALAAFVGLRRKTLDRRLRVAEVPAAERLIGWGRLLSAAMWLDDEAASVAGVSRELRFPSTCALRNLLRRYMGMSPWELRAAGGADALFYRAREEMIKAYLGRRVPLSA